MNQIKWARAHGRATLSADRRWMLTHNANGYWLIADGDQHLTDANGLPAQYGERHAAIFAAEAVVAREQQLTDAQYHAVNFEHQRQRLIDQVAATVGGPVGGPVDDPGCQPLPARTAEQLLQLEDTLRALAMACLCARHAMIEATAGRLPIVSNYQHSRDQHLRDARHLPVGGLDQTKGDQ